MKNNQWHVAKTGNDHNSGTEDSPFLTISQAALTAHPGDSVIVHEGTYREQVSPRFGGQGELLRITYETARGENVIIKGSEILENWENVKGSLWTARVDNTVFSGDNPYRELLLGDWFLDQGRSHHRGEVFLNGQSLFEKPDYESMKKAEPHESALDRNASRCTWYCEQDSENNATLFYCNFQHKNPNDELVEYSVRPACFYPRSTGLNYITVKGFEMCQTATPWAPPTAEQMGLIGPHWSKGWIIEDCHIHNAKCSGISLGKEQGSGENEWEHLGTKHGSQREREVIFRALKLGWSRETVGSHIVRNNKIHDCGQTGICGHLGAVFSQITDNHIYNIHNKDQFTGHEMGGIKIHASIDMLIKGNRIHHCTQGIWMDWQAQGMRMTGNLLYENRWNDIHIEVSHGPYVVDNNIFLSPLSIKNISQGGCYAHNLIGGRVLVQNVPNRFTPYHFPHSTDVLGVMTILGGDDRWYNNMFLPLDREKKSAGQKIIRPDENRELKKTDAFSLMLNRSESFGLSAYNEFPLSKEEWALTHTVNSYAVVRLPVTIEGNYYGQGAESFSREKNSFTSDTLHTLCLEERENEVILTLQIDEKILNHDSLLVTTKLLGSNFQVECPYEDFDGGPLFLDTDYFDGNRGKIQPGPFAELAPGKQTLVVWEN